MHPLFFLASFWATAAFLLSSWRVGTRAGIAPQQENPRVANDFKRECSAMHTAWDVVHTKRIPAGEP
jgi:hypothetical protein